MGAAFASLRATVSQFLDSLFGMEEEQWYFHKDHFVKKRRDTVRWYPDTRAEPTIAVPMPPFSSTADVTLGVPTSKVTWKFEPRERHRHMMIEVDYPLLETREAIRRSKVRIDASGSQEVEALQWEPLDKVPVDSDDRYIVIQAPLYQAVGFKIPNLRVVIVKEGWLEDRRVYWLSVHFHGPTKKVEAGQATRL